MERISTRCGPVKTTRRPLRSLCRNFQRLKPNRKRSAKCRLPPSRKARTSARSSSGFSCVHTRCLSRKIQALESSSGEGDGEPMVWLAVFCANPAGLLLYASGAVEQERQNMNLFLLHRLKLVGIEAEGFDDCR